MVDSDSKIKTKIIKIEPKVKTKMIIIEIKKN